MVIVPTEDKEDNVATPVVALLGTLNTNPAVPEAVIVKMLFVPHKV